jgi:hypothetical protein
MRGRKRLKAVTLAKTIKTSFDLRTEYIGGPPADAGPVEVQDPLNSEHKITLFRKLRDDPLGRLQDRKQIDEAQYLAGRRWQRAYEAAEIAGARAIDPTREVVDGGQISTSSISDDQARAFADLAKASKALGMIAESVVRDVLAHGMTTERVATARGYHDQRSQRYYARVLRDGLETLATVFGFKSGLDRGASKC